MDPLTPQVDRIGGGVTSLFRPPSIRDGLPLHTLGFPVYGTQKKNKIEKKNRIYHNITECVPPSCRPCPDSSDEFISADRFLTGCSILFDWFSVEFIDVTVCRVDPALSGFQT